MYTSVTTWLAQATCPVPDIDLEVLDSSIPGAIEVFARTRVVDLSVVQADLTQAGFQGRLLFPPVRNFLAVCWTYMWRDENGWTDINKDGKRDVAFREIYYNDRWEWSDTDEVPEGHFDFPTIALHEVGHGLSLGHVGTTFKDKDGNIHAKPRAVMNPMYEDMLRVPTGRDNGSFCDAWANW